MFSIYAIEFSSFNRDYPNNIKNTRFIPIAKVQTQGAAFAIAKAHTLDRGQKTIVIDGAGTPIGGY